jgi:hypothetical protein
LSWSYNPSDLGTTTASGRLNSVRLLIGDTDTNEQIMQDEEITFSLAQTNNNVYYAGSWACHMIASKYSRLVDLKIEGSLSRYSELAKQYITMSDHLNDLGKRTNGKSLGVSAGGISVADMTSVQADTDNVDPSFTVQQFDNKRAGMYTPDYFNGI